MWWETRYRSEIQIERERKREKRCWLIVIISTVIDSRRQAQNTTPNEINNTKSKWENNKSKSEKMAC